MQFVIDTWPLMEWVRGREPGRTRARELFRQVGHHRGVLYISRINLGKVYYNATRDYGEATALGFLKVMQEGPLEVVSVRDEHVDSAARLKARHRISFADGFAAALAIELALPIVTGDQDFLALEAFGLLKVHWLGA